LGTCPKSGNKSYEFCVASNNILTFKHNPPDSKISLLETHNP